MQIKTDCGKYSHSKDKKTFTFCQNGRCCSTGGLPAQDERCKQNNYQAYELGDCGKFHFDFESVEGNVTYHDIASAKDGWTPEWIKLVLGNGAVIKCPGYWALGSWNWVYFGCTPEGPVSSLILGKHNMLMVLVIDVKGDSDQLGFKESTSLYRIFVFSSVLNRVCIWDYEGPILADSY